MSEMQIPDTDEPDAMDLVHSEIEDEMIAKLTGYADEADGEKPARQAEMFERQQVPW
jgi:hypothetical protein